MLPTAQVSRARLLWILVLLLVLVAGGGGGWWAWQTWQVWRLERMAREAQTLLRAKSWDAVQLALSTLQRLYPEAPETWEVHAQLAEATGRPEALFWWRRLYDLDRSAPPTALTYALGAIRFGLPELAAAVLRDWPEGRGESERLTLVAALSLAQGDSHTWYLACERLASSHPQDPLHALNRDEAALWQTPVIAGAARARLQGLAIEPTKPGSKRALAILLRDAARRQDTADVALWAGLSEGHPESDWELQLLTLEAQGAVAAPELDMGLRRLQASAAGQPARASQLAGWMTLNQRAAEADAWLAGLPWSDTYPIALARAEALRLSGDNQRLRSLLRQAPWPERDYLRLALLHLAERDAHAGIGATTEARTWPRALETARLAPAGLADLARMLQVWRETNLALEVWWAWQDQEPRNPLPYLRLNQLYDLSQDTAGLARTAKAEAEAFPDNPIPANNAAYLHWLQHPPTPAELAAAEARQRTYPGRAEFSLTLAFGYWKAGRFQDAARLLDATPAVPQSPGTRLTHALILAARGEQTRAQALLEGIDAARLLPEERVLVETLQPVGLRIRS